VLSEGTRSLIIAKRVMAVAVVTKPTSVDHAKVQAFKHSVAIVVLVDAKSELCNGGLAIQGKVQSGHFFEAYRLAKQLAKQYSG
jgi:flagellar biosynthesis regulator FlbT